MSLDHFSFDDLFITVRDTRLRAFNRLVLAHNYYQDSPRLARLYLRFILSIDKKAGPALRDMRRQIKREGIDAVRQQIKYHINPYDATIYEAMTLPQLRLWHGREQARIRWS